MSFKIISPAALGMAAAALSALPVLGCGSDTSGSPEARAQAAVKDQITAQLGNLVSASQAIQAAAPAPDADGWSFAADGAAVQAMRTQWKAARVAYERVEGAIAVLFPNYDVSTDERYDGFLEAGPDDNLFDGAGVTGVHAIERILWANAIPAAVVDFESPLTGYQPARFPATASEATDFRDRLCARLVADTKAMQDMFRPLTLDTSAAFRGVIGSMGEQREKVELSLSGEEESRYAQHTLADMRANLEGGKTTYAGFRDWLLGTSGGAALDMQIAAGFARLDALYATVSGDSLPEVPAGFDPGNPSAAHLQTPFGRIFVGLVMESDPDLTGSLVSTMSGAADQMGIPQLPAE